MVRDGCAGIPNLSQGFFINKDHLDMIQHVIISWYLLLHNAWHDTSLLKVYSLWTFLPVSCWMLALKIMSRCSPNMFLASVTTISCGRLPFSTVSRIDDIWFATFENCLNKIFDSCTISSVSDAGNVLSKSWRLFLCLQKTNKLHTWRGPHRSCAFAIASVHIL